ncbi:SRPBCC domain-containing protein [Saccharomonospora sp. NPDC006951]
MANDLGTTTYTTPSDTEVVMARTVAAPRTLVWDVWTNPQHVPHWLTGPDGWIMPVCEIDLHPGGLWRYVWRNPETGGELEVHGTYREVTPPHRLVTTESWGPEWPETVNVYEFAEDNGKTAITITAHYPTKTARDAAIATGMADGMAMSYNRLADYLKELR